MTISMQGHFQTGCRIVLVYVRKGSGIQENVMSLIRQMWGLDALFCFFKTDIVPCFYVVSSTKSTFEFQYVLGVSNTGQ